MRYVSLIFLVALCAGAVTVHGKVGEPSTLSRLGIDFGAAELLRYTEIGLSEKQKRAALRVVRGQKPKIEKLCKRMTVALGMKETDQADKRMKNAELAEIVEEFTLVQGEIMDGLHALVSEEQMTKLNAIKQREKRLELEAQAGTKSAAKG
jgi:hypothetical protein